MSSAYDLSIVIPSYNAATWLPETLRRLGAAVRLAGLKVEVIVVDDGSTDGTGRVVEGERAAFPGHLIVVEQENKGRFLARWSGLLRAGAPQVMLLDARVHVDVASIRNIWESIESSPDVAAWNGYVVTDQHSPLVGLFWEVPTYVFWGRFRRRPRTFDLNADTFDSAPKGTGLFLANREVLEEAFRAAWPTGDARLVSDDTKLLRYIASTRGIRLEPEFSGVYLPRTSVGAFLRHTLDRGTLFVDSYAGTSGLRSVIIFALALSPLAIGGTLVALVTAGRGGVAATLLVGGIVATLFPMFIAVANRCPPRSAWAYVACLPIFTGPFWLGIVRGLWLHRAAFLRAEGNA